MRRRKQAREASDGPVRRRPVGRPLRSAAGRLPRRVLLALVLCAALALPLASCGVPDRTAVRDVDVPAVPSPSPSQSPPRTGTGTGEFEGVVYFVRGSRLEAVPRRDDRWVVQRALDHLGDGPTRAEAATGLRTALSPQELDVLSGPSAGIVTVSVGTAFLRLAGDDQKLAVAQVVWTVTQFPSVDRVRFSVEDSLLEVPTDRGLTGAAVSRASYRSVAPLPAASRTPAAPT